MRRELLELGVKRRCIRVRVVADPTHEQGFRIVAATSGRSLGGVIPSRYTEEFRKARPGHRIKAWAFTDPPLVDPTTHNVITEPVSFHVVSVEIPEAPA